MKIIKDLENELTTLIENRNQSLDKPSIDKLIEEKRDEIMECLNNIKK